MGRRRKRAVRCERCRMHVDTCLCEHIVPQELRSRLALVMHHREASKATATGPLALAALPNSRLYVHGLRDAALDLNHLHDDDRRVMLLFPREGARVLDRALLAEDTRPVTLVVPDGSWKQATSAGRRIPGLERAEAVTLPPGPPTRWGVRQESKAAGLATFEAIARALGILESLEVQTALESLFDRMVATTHAARGAPQNSRASASTSLVRGVDANAASEPSSSPASDAFSDASNDPGLLSIVYADEHLVAINKPSGLLVHRGWGNDEKPAMQRVRDQIGQYIYPVHRLDRATSGVLLFALSSEVARDMQGLFQQQAIIKSYLALCRGHSEDLRQVDHPLAKTKDDPKRSATTDFRLLGHFERYGLFEALPRTGRVHQIRRHLKHASHPIIGDVRYGKGEHNRIFRERFDFHRLALHCQSLSFQHPRTGKALVIRASLSADFAALLSKLGLRDLSGCHSPSIK